MRNEPPRTKVMPLRLMVRAYVIEVRSTASGDACTGASVRGGDISAALWAGRRDRLDQSAEALAEQRHSDDENQDRHDCRVVGLQPRLEVLQGLAESILRDGIADYRDQDRRGGDDREHCNTHRLISPG